MSFLQTQSSNPNIKHSGCNFCCCCYAGGLNSLGEVEAAYNWALGNGYIRSDCYVNMGWEALAQKIAQNYGRSLRHGLIRKGNGKHFWLVDSSGREVYNAAGIGYR